LTSQVTISLSRRALFHRGN